jgi:hypothetical protein
MTVFRHSLMIRFNSDATDEQKQALYEGLATMPHVMDFIRRYEFGPDLGHGSDNPDMALVADFDNEEDWREYSAHPDHLDLINNLVSPITAEAIRIQYEVD